MSIKDKEFWVWTVAECIKSTYEWWGVDMMSMYDNIKEDFPNAVEAIRKMYDKFNEEDVYEANGLAFDKTQFVYQAIANLIPSQKQLKFDVRSTILNSEYSHLNMCAQDEFMNVERIDLIMAVLLFTEEFIFEPITNKKIYCTDEHLIVYGDLITYEVSKDEEKTYVSVTIFDVMFLQFVILN